jgi:hypothetical protein
MVISMKASMYKESHMVKECTFGKMAIYIKENS